MTTRKNVNEFQVQSTNDASIVSKCSTARKKYIDDDYVRHFVEKEKNRASLIHLGYYTRAVIFSKIVSQFIEFLNARKFEKFQIISCGSGFDTTYWKLTDFGLLDKQSIFIEIDYPNVIDRKVLLIKQSDKLKSLLNLSQVEEESNIKKLSSNYFLLSADLCDVENIEEYFKKISVDFSIPTLFLSECVITYMQVEHSNQLLQWVSEKFTHCGFMNYEQIHPEDGFGEVMLRHFDKLQSTLHSVNSYPNIESHKQRYTSLGFNASAVYSEWDLFTYVTTNEDRNRAFTLEQFDEFEEFHLKCVHYVVSISTSPALALWPDRINAELSHTSQEDLKTRNICSVSERNVNLEIFGHCSCQLENGKVLVFGGFSPKGRSRKVYEISGLNVEEVFVSGLDNLQLDAVHGSVVAFQLKGKQYIGLYGGRTSPNKIINEGYFIILEYKEKVLALVSKLPCPATPRYRNTSVCQWDESKASIWIFGGRTQDLNDSLPELWQLTIYLTDNGSLSHDWVMKDQENQFPKSRMSHSSAICLDTKNMYITCGLEAENFSVLNDIWKWSSVSESWECLKPLNRVLLPRCGHTSHIHNKVLYLIGGVNTIAGSQPGLAILDLKTLNLKEYILEAHALEPSLFFNHSSSLIKDENGKEGILISGGGGNCFSFGTYFNKVMYLIYLTQFEDFW